MKTKLFATLILVFGILFRLQAQDPLTNGLVAYYPFNGNANDASGNGHNAVVMGAGLQITNGVGDAPNSAYRGLFSGNTNNLAASGINLSNSSLSITLWFKKDYQPYTIDHGSILTLGTQSSSGKQLHIRPYLSGVQFRFSFFNDDFDVSNPVGNGNWTHIACTYDNVTRERRIYFDGNLIATNIAVRGFTGTSDLLLIPAGLGSAPSGLIDNVRIYGRVLSPSEVAQIHQIETVVGFESGLVAYYPFNGNANDESGSGHHGTVFGATLSADRFGNTNSAYYFDGTAYISLPNGVYFSGNFTVSGWANLSEIRPGCRLVDFANNGLVTDPFAIVPHVTLSLSEVNPGQPRGDVSGNPNSVLSSIALPLNKWVQVTWTLSGQTTVLYVNGNKVAQQTWAVPPAAVVLTNNWIGRCNWENTPAGCQRPRGVLDDIRIYDRAFSSNEVAALYALESGPLVDLIKAVKPAFQRLFTGTNYQLQLSGDMLTWTNHGTPFIATNSSMVYPQYWDVDNWGKLFFRLQVAP